ncbi:MAG: Holliday junction branch migration protein RuvA [Prevotellaceae bacterium]|jgi:Holliday junction DNA helicase RuvA|nr:Holliday junction branch migration protein RuvA [Prevotellaceae bacterium]
MYEYIKGPVAELSPTHAVVEAGSIGYHILISLQTFSALQQEKGQVRLWLHHHEREDAALFYGFWQKSEREMFRLLIGASGIGPNSARMILSSLPTDELRQALLTEDFVRLKSIKGIGLKTAQRLIVELKDKVAKVGFDGEMATVGTGASVGYVRSSIREEAATALQMLGFPKAAVEKTIDQLLRIRSDYSIEELIKVALKQI